MDDSTRISARKVYKICPQCKGKGYFEATKISRLDGQQECENGIKIDKKGKKAVGSNYEALPENVASHLTLDMAYSSYPPSQVGARSKHALTTSACSSRSILQLEKLKPEKPWSSDNNNTASVDQTQSGTRMNLLGMKPFGSDTSVNSELSDLIQKEKLLGDPREAIKVARNKIKSIDWDQIMCGLEDIAILSRNLKQEGQKNQGDYTKLGDSNNVFSIIDWETIGLSMTKLVASFRLQKTRSVRMTCQILKELFQLMALAVHRPQFDDAVHELMKRTADTSKLIRGDARLALDTMVSFVPVQFSTRAILNQAPKHKNREVRLTAMRLIDNIVEMITPEALFTQPQYKEIRKQIVNNLCFLIDDPSQHVRWIVRKTLHSMLPLENFDEVINADVEPHTLQKADRSLTLLQYDMTTIG